MLRRLIVIGCVVMFAATTAIGAEINRLTPEEEKAGWKLLFDGETFDGWQAIGDINGWAIEDGAILNLSRGGHVIGTKERFGDFKLSIDYKLDPQVNSGLFFRWSHLPDPVQTGIELQIYDSYGKQNPNRNDCGAIYDCLAPRMNACKPAGEWNTIVLTCRKNLIWADLNGKRIIYMNLDKWTTAGQNPDGSPNKFRTAYKDMSREGHIGMQDHGGKVWFRNIKIREL